MKLKISKYNCFPYSVYADTDGYGAKGEGVYALGTTLGTIYAQKPQPIKKVSEAQALMAGVKDTFSITVIKDLTQSLVLKQGYLLKDQNNFTYRIINDPAVLNTTQSFTLIIEET